MKITDDPLEAAAFLKRGKIVIFPTETVFGIGADATNLAACRQIYAIKGRPSDNPLILHTGSASQLMEFGEIDASVLQMFSPFIPGPLTLILKKRRPDLFSADLSTVGLRIPAHETTLKMLQALPFPVAAPSANLSGKPSLTRIEDVIETFSGKADLLLRGEEPVHGIESTVLDLSKQPPLYLRPGVVSFEELKLLLPDLDRWSGGDKPPSPGMKYRHYAPTGKVEIYHNILEIKTIDLFAEIGFEVTGKGALSRKVFSNTEYARELYAFFTLSDRKGIKSVYCQFPHAGVLQEALLERLLKASQG